MNTQSITLDVSKQPGMTPILRIGQGDKNGTIIEATIYDNGAPLSLSGYSVRFEMRLPDGTSYYQSPDGTISDNVATIPIDETYAGAVDGITKIAYIVVYSGSVECSTSRINVIVLESAEEGADAAHAYESGITQATEAATSAAELANTKAGLANSAAELANNKAGLADTAATSANNAATAATNAANLATEAAETVEQLTADLSGSVVTADDAYSGGQIKALTIYGASTQDGTPTPSAPVAIESVESANVRTCGRNILNVGSDDVNTTIYNPTTAKPMDGDGIWVGLSYDGYLRPGQISSYSIDGSTVKVTKSSSVGYGLGVEASVVAGATYVLSFSSIANGNIRITYFDKDGKYVSNTTAKTSTFSDTAPSSARFALVGVYPTTENVECSAVDLQLEAGSTTTAYTPYLAGTTTTPDLDGHVLRSLPDGTKDSATWTADGVALTQKLGIWNMRDYASSNSWIKSGGATNGYYFPCSTLGAKTAQYGNILCNCATAVGTASEYFTTTNSTYCDTFMNFNLDASIVGSTLADFKTWLASHDLYVVAELATPTTATLPSITMPTAPSSDMTAWVDSEPATTLDLTYRESLQLVIDDLKAQIAALATS